MASSTEVIRTLLAEGWIEQPRKGGSRRQFNKDGHPLKVTVPDPERELPIGTLRSIYRTAGWKWPSR